MFRVVCQDFPEIAFNRKVGPGRSWYICGSVGSSEAPWTCLGGLWGLCCREGMQDSCQNQFAPFPSQFGKMIFANTQTPKMIQLQGPIGGFYSLGVYIADLAFESYLL